MGLFGLITFDPFYKTNNTLILHALVACSNLISDIHNVFHGQNVNACTGVHLTCNACLFVYFFNLFVGLFGLITFDPFYKTNNTLILHALVAMQLDFGHSQCFANRTRRQSRLVRFATL